MTTVNGYVIGPNADLRGANLFGVDLSRADLYGANLRGANLRWANLRWADLSGADLSEADLRGADLRGADLRGADLSGANLFGVDLSRANLRGANLRWANLRWANLRWADLSRADLSGADLSGADLYGADLSGADLYGAKEIPAIISARLSIVPEKGAYIAWKKCQGDVIVELLIPAEAKRSNGTGRKCRAEFAQIVAVYGAEFGVSQHDGKTEYRTGEIVRCNTWEENRWIECAGGIHHFITRAEAEAY